jgi:hypothetical protein
MKNKLLSPLLLLCLALTACLPAQTPAATEEAASPPAPAVTEAMPFTATSTLPSPSATATLTPHPTDPVLPTVTSTPAPAFTATPDPAVYNPVAFGDNRLLDSFVMSLAWKDTGKNYLYDYQTKSEYNHSPVELHITSKFTNGKTSTWDDSYWLEDWDYRKDNLTGLWAVVKADPQDKTSPPLDSLDLRKAISISYFQSAKYLGIETYKGIPAYHYTFDQTNLAKLENIQIDKALGELFLSVEGRYPLHSYARFSGKLIPTPGANPPWAEGVKEFTQDLISFNQPVKISLPPDYPNPDLNLDIPFPPGTSLRSYFRTAQKETIYTYVTPADKDGYKAFYTALKPTNGWSAAKFIDLKGPVVFCKECASLSKGNQQVVLEFGEEFFDFEHKDFIISVHFVGGH